MEWGENLAEGLAPSFLEIAIAPAEQATGPASPEDEADEPRTVRVTGWGDRWAQAAQAARGALSATP